MKRKNHLLGHHLLYSLGALFVSLVSVVLHMLSNESGSEEMDAIRGC